MTVAWVALGVILLVVGLSLLCWLADLVETVEDDGDPAPPRG